MNISIQLFIGQNNETKKLEIDKITKILSLSFDGFTVQKGVGFWRGAQEKTAIVSIYDKESEILKAVEVLKKELNQDAIAMQKMQPLQFI